MELKKYIAIAIVTVLTIVFISKVEAAGPRLIDLLESVISDIQTDYDEIERMKSRLTIIQGGMHERAEKIRMVQCGLGEQSRCPDLPQPVGSYDEIGEPHSITATNYHSKPEQTDHDPCTAAWGHNICHFGQKGLPIVAVSRDLLWQYGEGDWVYLQHEEELCTGVFMVLDKLNHTTLAGRIITNQLDIYRSDITINHGVCFNVRAVKIERPLLFSSDTCGLPNSTC